MMPPDFLNYLNIFLALCLFSGGFFAMRRGFFEKSGAIQQQTIDAMKTRMETLESQVESDEKEINRLRQLLNTVRHALKRRGLHIEIDGDYVTIIDADGQAKSTQITPHMARVRPVKLTSIEEDNDDAI